MIYAGKEMTIWDLVEMFDQHLDDGVAQEYKDHPIAQHWARVAKVAEEGGEAIAELISWTGQNPRKPQDNNAYDRLLKELADTALTAIYAIQHFTKNHYKTSAIIEETALNHGKRVGLLP